MPEEKRKINCWIPISLYEKIEPTGYESVTQAVIEGLQRILEDPHEDTKESNEDTKGSSQYTEGYLKDIEALTSENTQLKEDISGHEKDIIGYKQDIEGSKKDLERIQEGYKQDVTGYKENINALNTEITRLRESLANSPDPVDLVRLQERNDGLNLVIAEKEKRIEDITREVTTLNGFAHYFKTAEVKQIEAPASEKVKPWWKIW
jgi:predicted RNase H-like nuclease (RuvC/YqgF family)